MPSKDWIDTFDKDPEHAMSDSYDIVCNGNEMGGGSVRIHRDDIQDRVLDVLASLLKRLPTSSASCLKPSSTALRRTLHRSRLGSYRRHPAGADSIRDVIAFPKAGGGRDPLTGAPAPISDEQRAETGVDYDPEEDED